MDNLKMLARLSCQSDTSIIIVAILLAILLGVIIWYIFESRRIGAIAGLIAFLILVGLSVVSTICGILPLGVAPTEL